MPTNECCLYHNNWVSLHISHSFSLCSMRVRLALDVCIAEKHGWFIKLAVVFIRWQTEWCYTTKHVVAVAPLVCNRQLFPFISVNVFLRFDRNENGTIFIRYTKHNKHSILHIVWIRAGSILRINIMCSAKLFHVIGYRYLVEKHVVKFE